MLKPMKPIVLVAALAASLLSLSACAAPSREVEANLLRDQLSALPDVVEVALEYSEPIVLDSGKLSLVVSMRPGAAPGAVTQVITTTYGAFVGVHNDEEGELEVVLAEDAIHLRSFESVAKIESVAKAAADAVSVLDSGTVRAEIMTQEVSADAHVFTTYDVGVEESGRVAMLQKLAELETVHGAIANARWQVQGGGEYGWLLAEPEQGFPGTAQHVLFQDLSKDLPEGAAISLYSMNFAVMQVPDGASPKDVSVTVGRHLRLLGGSMHSMYHVENGPEVVATFGYGECFFDEGVVGAQLERDHGAGCSEVTRD